MPHCRAMQWAERGVRLQTTWDEAKDSRSRNKCMEQNPLCCPLSNKNPQISNVHLAKTHNKCNFPSFLSDFCKSMNSSQSTNPGFSFVVFSSFPIGADGGTPHLALSNLHLLLPQQIGALSTRGIKPSPGNGQIIGTDVIFLEQNSMRFYSLAIKQPYIFRDGCAWFLKRNDDK